MSTTALKICVEALSLPRENRLEIAERLLASVEDAKASTRAERLRFYYSIRQQHFHFVF